MSKDTSIGWCDSTVNPTMGCDGCELWNAKDHTCYAGQLHQIRGGNPGYAPTFSDVTMFAGRMAKAAKWTDLTGTNRPEKPWLDGMPRIIFISDMSDALSKAVPFDFLKAEIIDLIHSEGRRHIWMWLTKRPKRMAEFNRYIEERGSRWPENLWPGTSITTQGTVRRLIDLANVGHERTVRFLSVEPQRQRVHLLASGALLHAIGAIHLVIQGGESGGRDAQPFDIAWADDMKAQCETTGTHWFLKQVGANPVGMAKPKDRKGEDWSQWPERLRVRSMPRDVGVVPVNRLDAGRRHTLVDS